MMRKSYIILGFIFILGFFLRTYILGDVPDLHRDEAFLGYNAYSILSTGKDISNDFFPLHLKSYLYSPSGYSFFSIPFIAVFGLSEFSVRLASAFFGSLTLLCIYFFTRNLFGQEKYRESIALFAAFTLAISPWHINLSRTVTENVLVTFMFMVALIVLQVFGKEKRVHWLLFGFLFFGISIFTYQAPRAFLPLFIPLAVFILLPATSVKKHAKTLIALYFIVILVPIVFVLSSDSLALRIRSLSIFHNEYTPLVIHEQITTDGAAGIPLLVTRVFHNKVVAYSQLFLENYFNHLSYDFLFADKGLPDRYRVPHTGLLYIWQLPFMLFSFFKLFTSHKKIGTFLLGWILLTPIGSALTYDDVPNLQRTLFVVPVYGILTSYGLVVFYDFVKKWLFFKRVLFGVLSIVILYSFSLYFIQYYVQAPVYRPWYRQDGYRELVGEVNKRLPDYKKAVITNRESAPAIFFLFYSKYDPSLFQNEVDHLATKDYDRVGFSQYEFSQEECPARVEEKEGEKILKAEKDILYVNSSLCKIPEELRIIHTVKRSDGSNVFYVLDKK